jgi:hypothetical protein
MAGQVGQSMTGRFVERYFHPYLVCHHLVEKDVGKFHIDQRDYNMKNIILKVPISLRFLLLALTEY